MTRVCHISTVHHERDNRVLEKECAALARAGYEVFWLVQSETSSVLSNGVKVVPLRPVRSRLRRWLFSGWEALFKGLRTQATVFHFHDLEFIPHALLLRAMGKSVVYDIHEDHVTSLRHKHYLSDRWGERLGRWLGGLERIASHCFETVIAERSYGSRFPEATVVLNYPVARTVDPPERSETNLLYTGSVTPARGGQILAQIPRYVDNTRVHLIGRCEQKFHTSLVADNPVADRLSFHGVSQFLPFQEITEAYEKQPWLAGLALFPPSENYGEKELTKLFEYMQFGIPIIASNFPKWKQLVEGNGCGICVDATDPIQIRDAVNQLRDSLDLWQAMSRAGLQAAKKYTWESQSKRLLNLYARLGKTQDQPRMWPAWQRWRLRKDASTR